MIEKIRETLIRYLSKNKEDLISDIYVENLIKENSWHLYTKRIKKDKLKYFIMAFEHYASWEDISTKLDQISCDVIGEFEESNPEYFEEGK